MATRKARRWYHSEVAKLNGSVHAGPQSHPADACRSDAERDALKRLIEYGLPAPRCQYQFDMRTPRRRADFAWPQYSVMLEIDGGTFGIGGKPCPTCKQSPVGGHNRGKAYEKDRLRDALAMAHGWVVIRATPDLMKVPAMLESIERVLMNRGFVPASD